MIKTLRISLIVLCFAYPLSANAWFFFFLPGSATRAIGDALTGSKGNICVAESRSVGEVVTSPNTGDTAKILSLSGTSSICPNPALPFRAEIEFTFSFSPKAGVELPDEYEVVPLKDLERFNGWILKAKSKLQNNQGISIVSYKRRPDLEMEQMANNIESKVMVSPNLKDAVSENAEKLTVNGMPAIRFQVTGTLKGLFASQETYLYTLIQGDEEILAITAYAPADKFQSVKPDFIGISEKIVGISSSSTTGRQQPQEQENDKVEMKVAMDKCLDLGFKKGTESYGQCVLKLSK